ncbi:MAG: diguanylate cyclase, partial [Spirochaetaceae bacterium]|nr:diguanylate cyclase [Spirochaetaceae bacterium]
MGTSFVALAMITLLVALLAFVAVFVVGLGGYSDRISKDYAILYGNEIGGELESQLGREITLSVAAAADPDIRDWLLAEDDAAVASRAARSLTALGEVFQGRDIFVAAAATGNFRFFPKGSTVDPSLVSGILARDNPEDLWFFKSLALPGDYTLNIDTDRFLRTTRVWVNCPVRAGGRVAGVIGTGLHLDPLVRAILSGHERHGARSILINAYGAIQLDQDLGNITENSYGSPVGVEGTVYSYHGSPGFRTEIERYLRDPKEPVALRLSGGEYQYAALVPIAGTGWHAVTFFGLGQLYDPRVLVTMGAVLALVLALAVLALSLGMRQLFLRPFRALVESLDHMTADGGASVAGLSRRDEFGSLARSVRDLAERLVQSVPAGMFLLDAEGRFTFGNRYFLRQFGCDDATAFARRFDADLPGLFRSESDYHLLRRFLHDHRELLVLETQLVDSGGTAFWARLHLKRVMKRSGIEEYEGLLLNIQDQKDNEDRLAAIASTDQLTGLYNRRYLEQWMTVALGKSDRSGERASLVMFDLDHFKRVNDLHGHDVGDEVLVAAAAAAKALLRDADNLIRWGGEEFAAILPNTGLEGALLVAEKLRASLASRPHPKAGVVTAS